MRTIDVRGVLGLRYLSGDSANPSGMPPLRCGARSPLWRAAKVAGPLQHELGHELGINFELDDEFEINPSHVGGSNFTVEADSLSGHIAAQASLMCDGCGIIGVRRLPSAIDIMAIAEDQGMTQVDLRRQDFITGGGDWNTPGNWYGNTVPDSDDDATIRTPNASTVALSGQGHVENLTVLGPNALAIGTNTLFVDGVTKFDSSAIATFSTGGLLFSGMIEMIDSSFLLDGGSIIATDGMTIDDMSTVSGRGQIDVVDGDLVNEGLIRALGGSLFRADLNNGFRLDLDGTSDTGQLEVTGGDLIVRTVPNDTRHCRFHIPHRQRSDRERQPIAGWI